MFKFQIPNSKFQNTPKFSPLILVTEVELPTAARQALEFGISLLGISFFLIWNFCI
jgi:hypothetical protein